MTTFIPSRSSWQSRPSSDKMLPSIYHKPSIPPVVKTLSTKPISAPPQYIPRPIPRLGGFDDTSPNWYQSDTPTKKISNPSELIR